MTKNIYAEVLARAAAHLGGTHALAAALRAPDATLKRWMKGHAQMPLRAFREALDHVLQHEHLPPGTAADELRGNGEAAVIVRLAFGALLARCGDCSGVEFLAPGGAALPLASMVSCRGCGVETSQAELALGLARRIADNPTRRRKALASQRTLRAPVSIG